MKSFRSPKLQPREGSGQPLPEGGPAAPGGCCEGQRVEWGGELKGLTGTCWGSPGTGKEAKARGGQFRFRCRSKSM